MQHVLPPLKGVHVNYVIALPTTNHTSYIAGVQRLKMSNFIYLNGSNLKPGYIENFDGSTIGINLLLTRRVSYC